jgi:hypothetical protein
MTDIIAFAHELRLLFEMEYNLPMKRAFTIEEARRIGELIGVDFSSCSLEEFQMGLSVELEHGAHDSETNVTGDNELITGKIAWAHLKEIPDYYPRLKKMEAEAEGK